MVIWKVSFMLAPGVGGCLPSSGNRICMKNNILIFNSGIHPSGLIQKDDFATFNLNRMANCVGAMRLVYYLYQLCFSLHVPAMVNACCGTPLCHASGQRCLRTIDYMQNALQDYFPRFRGGRKLKDRADWPGITHVYLAAPTRDGEPMAPSEKIDQPSAVCFQLAA